MDLDNPSIELIFQSATVNLGLLFFLEIFPHGKLFTLSDHLGLLQLVEVCYIELFNLFRGAQLREAFLKYFSGHVTCRMEDSPNKIALLIDTC